jgi:hypothetical protein
MKKALLVIFGLFVLVVAVVIVIITLRPDELTVTRTAVYDATPERIFPELNDFHNWEAWSPWAKIDPQMKTTYSGPQAGVGSSYAWEGNSQVGKGRMTIVYSRPNEGVKIDLEFLEPFATRSVTEFLVTPEADKTRLTWNMSMKNGFIGKAIGLVADMDKMLGSDFEKGLAQLKPVVESE